MITYCPNPPELTLPKILVNIQSKKRRVTPFQIAAIASYLPKIRTIYSFHSVYLVQVNFLSVFLFQFVIGEGAGEEWLKTNSGNTSLISVLVFYN